MRVKRFLTYMIFGGQKPDSVHGNRWHAMVLWYKKRNENGDWLDSEL